MHNFKYYVSLFVDNIVILMQNVVDSMHHILTLFDDIYLVSGFKTNYYTK